MTEKESNNRALKVQSMADLVNYQDGSVVSREIIRKSTGTVTLFAFDEGQGLSEHTAPFDALVYVVDGQVEVFNLRQSPSSESRRFRNITGQRDSCPESIEQIQDAISNDKILSSQIADELSPLTQLLSMLHPFSFSFSLACPLGLVMK